MVDLDPTPEIDVDVDEEPVALGLPVRSSVEKLQAIGAELVDVEPDDPMQAALLSMLAGMAPMLTGLLPDDPAELDDLLLVGSRWMLAMRSDDAWQPVDLDELFLGAGPQPEPAA
jgi:hypothetical protein